jgi:enediyne biosynthesis protein E4
MVCVVSTAGGRRSTLIPACLLCAFAGCTKAPAPHPPAAAPSAPRGEEAFVDVTARAGIAFRHVTGATGKYYLIETFGGGAAWLDYDRDGQLDLYIVNSHEDPYNGLGKGKAGNALYRNKGDGTFEDVTARAGVGDRGYGMGVAVGDYDNDGYPDIYVTNCGPDVLYHNDGNGKFTDVTEAAGVSSPLWNTSATFVDVDGDGFLDLYVCSYLLYDPHTAKECRTAGKSGYCHPREFSGTPDRLYRNRGDGTFEEIGARAGIAIAGPQAGKGLGCIATDIDDDGDQDLYVANDETPSFLFRNRGNGVFDEIALEVGVALDRNGKTEAGMGVDVGDVDGDGLMDILKINYSYETNDLFVQEPGGFFRNDDMASGMGAHTYLPLGFGCALFDYDSDGDLDVYVACGHIMDDEESTAGLGAAQPDLLFRNRGDGTFDNAGPDAGAWFRERMIGRGAAFGDFDNDGAMDIFVVNKNDRGVLLKNCAHRGHWLRLELRGTRSNRDGYGTRVTMRRGRETRVFEVRSGRSYCSAADSRPLIGLGTGGPPDSLTLRWPSGAVQTLRDLPLDTTVKVVEPSPGP